jgi:hypothetical protein
MEQIPHRSTILPDKQSTLALELWWVYWGMFLQLVCESEGHRARKKKEGDWEGEVETYQKKAGGRSQTL